jgi:hypothetical protein
MLSVTLTQSIGHECPSYEERVPADAGFAGRRCVTASL